MKTILTSYAFEVKKRFYHQSEMTDSREPLAELKLRLGKTLRIKMDDGRVIEGEFQCMDKDLNFIIGGATEYHGMTNRKLLTFEN